MDCMNFIESLAERAKSASPAVPEDYIQDGLIFCGKCGTPKQTRLQFGGLIVSCLCQCQSEAYEREQEKQRSQDRLNRISQLRSLGFPDIETARCTFECDDWRDKKLSSACRRYVDRFPDFLKRGRGLLLYGPVGTGKSFLSAGIANALIEQGRPCLVTNFIRLTNTLQDSFEGRQDYIDRLRQFQLLVIDDLAAERDTDYMGEQIYSIIDARYRQGLPLIVTTNLTAEELKNPGQLRRQRIFSRLFEMCVPIEVKGADRRRQILRNEHDELKEMLGL